MEPQDVVENLIERLRSVAAELGPPVSTVRNHLFAVRELLRATIRAEVRKVHEGKGKSGQTPELWDGRAAARIIDVLVE